MHDAGPVLVFDSGLGGVSVVRAISQQMPRIRLVYVADDAAFPYGDWEDDALRTHIVELMGRLIAQYRPTAVVIACNTASTLVLPALRARYDIPFVGTVPAIKPAAEQTKTGIIAVLATPGTMRRDYTRDLIRKFASLVHVRLVGAPLLAAFAEARMRGEAIDERSLAEQIEPCFVEIEGRRTDMVVLACTHYPFLTDLFDRHAPWPVCFIDPAPAIARRLASVLEGRRVDGGPGTAAFTSGRPVLAPVLQVLRQYRLAVA
ncbi:glutamate racemase [Afifella marina]|uniref:Glutamate racemase n=1 Tax=Afifella marina DSM 2698 TaxID=1120955 RepID=A0A1G5PBT1_AFIMA|nr:glutamate racemase [Afifella marina]MBK1625532.1 glutamate racemase [Afifella marina DSM 2698]MBK1629129.1 glutamate racemase [Afifella marina]MBK5917340.1 glutamate racemase [Afifella marina]RAI17350.1 glutamate racemase [Afifella marina DSM 2698]SCZ46748.1 glutamate racemase [Afifella marina DSM 2698]